MQTAQDIMTHDPTTCKENHCIYDAVRVMADEDCGVVPVVDQNNCCIGIITDRDICLEVVLNRLDSQTKKLGDVMNRNIVTCKKDEPLDSVLSKMQQNKIRRIVVVDERDCCIGIISEGDIALRDDKKEQVRELVEAVVK